MDVKVGTGRLSEGSRRRRRVVELDDQTALADILPQFPPHKSYPEVNLPMLRLAVRDLIERMKAGQVEHFHLHNQATGEYGRYTVDLFFQFQGISKNAHIDIIERMNIVAVFVLDITAKTVNSVFPRHAHFDQSFDLHEELSKEMEEVIELLVPNEPTDKKTGEASA